MVVLLYLTRLYYGGNRFSLTGGAIDGAMTRLKKKYALTAAELAEFDALAAGILDDPEFIASKAHAQHGSTSVHAHSVSVALTAFAIAKRRGWRVSYPELVRGALLHDFFGYDWHEKGGGHRLHGYFHPYRALKRARRFGLTRVERSVILRHMWPLTLIPPGHKESFLVMLADKLCALGEMLERYLSAAGIERRWSVMAAVPCKRIRSEV